MTYALIIHSKACPDMHVPAGQEFWVIKDDWGPSSLQTNHPFCPNGPPEDLWTFPTEKAAHKFAKTWKGHPWWCNPIKGLYRVVEVLPVMIPKHVGWKIKE